jgi:hypothetical protein
LTNRAKEEASIDAAGSRSWRDDVAPARPSQAIREHLGSLRQDLASGYRLELTPLLVPLA